MTRCLVLRLAGPMQSWGTESRYARRTTAPSPSKSGVLGLLAAAQGRRRTDPMEDLLQLRFGVRVDQPGRLIRDFQTARSLDGTRTMPLSYRFYLADAVFLAVVEGDDALTTALDDAVRNPLFPLYLGRRSCPPAGPISLGLREAPLEAVLRDEPWRASPWWQQRSASDVVRLDISADLAPEADPASPAQLLRDVPVSFDPQRREYGWRHVVHSQVSVPTGGPSPTARAHPGHDPMLALGGS